MFSLCTPHSLQPCPFTPPPSPLPLSHWWIRKCAFRLHAEIQRVELVLSSVERSFKTDRVSTGDDDRTLSGRYRTGIFCAVFDRA